MDPNRTARQAGRGSSLLTVVFNLCEANNAVKAFTYINVDWEAGSSSSTWGDTQVQHAPDVIGYWKTNISSFLHADSDLYSLISYP